MTKLQIMSDLHLEFGGSFEPPIVGNILVLAGDITTKGHYDWIINQTERFQEVVYIAGNHEYYDSNFQQINQDLTDLDIEYEHLHILFGGEKRNIHGVNIIAGTLWTPMGHDCIATSHWLPQKVTKWMTDFQVTYIDLLNGNYTKMTTDFVYEVHKATVKSMEAAITQDCVVVTHHAPSSLSVSNKYKGLDVNVAFHCNLEDMIAAKKPKLWIHGHMHDSSDYQLYDTRVVCNPRGYWGYEINPNFDPTFVVEV